MFYLLNASVASLRDGGGNNAPEYMATIIPECVATIPPEHLATFTGIRIKLAEGHSREQCPKR